MRRRWQVVIYGADVTGLKVSVRAFRMVRAWSRDGAARKARRWYYRLQPGAIIWEVKVQRLHLR